VTLNSKLKILILFGADSKLEWGRSFQLAKAFVKLGHQLLYIDLPNRLFNGVKESKHVEQNESEISIFRPQFGLPYGRFPVFRNVNKKIILYQVQKYLKHRQFSPDVIWVYSLYEPAILAELKKIYKPLRVVYDCADERVSYAEMTGGEMAGQRVKKLESEIIKQCDIVFTITNNLKTLKSALSTNIHVLPNGIDLSMFNESIEYNKPYIYNRLQGRIILYIGSIERWVDLKLIERCAKTLTDVNFVFVGPCNVDVSPLLNINNIIFVGKVPYSAVPGYIKYCDTCIIPFVSDGMITYSNTLKALQYLAMNKKVIATYYDGVNDYVGLVDIANGTDEFIEKIQCINYNEQLDQAKLRQVLLGYTWLALASKATELLKQSK